MTEMCVADTDGEIDVDGEIDGEEYEEYEVLLRLRYTRYVPTRTRENVFMRRESRRALHWDRFAAIEGQVSASRPALSRSLRMEWPKVRRGRPTGRGIGSQENRSLRGSRLEDMSEPLKTSASKNLRHGRQT